MDEEKDKGEQFYDYLKTQDIKVPDTYGEFSSKMSDTETASQFHTFVKEKGIKVPDTSEEFQSVFASKEGEDVNFTNASSGAQEQPLSTSSEGLSPQSQKVGETQKVDNFNSRVPSPEEVIQAQRSAGKDVYSTPESPYTMTTSSMAGEIKGNKPKNVASPDKPKPLTTLEKAEKQAEDIASWANRGAVKYLGKDINDTEEVENDFSYKSDVDNSTKELDEIEDKFVEGKTNKFGHWTYTNQFDAKKGFDYVPISNVGNSTHDTSYNNVQGIAHFLLDADLSQENPYLHEYSVKMRDNQLKGKPAQELGSTVDEFFFPVYSKKEDGKVNVKYLKKDEIDDVSTIMSPLRQYKFSDLDWEGKTSAQGFKSSVSSIPTKVAHPTKGGSKSNESHFIFGTEEGKKTYGKYGGNSVVFIVDKPNSNRKVVEMAGSVYDIEKMGKEIIKNEGINPEDLIIGYHDVGSFSAKPKAVDGKLSFSQWSGFNDEKMTGGALAIPSLIQSQNTQQPTEPTKKDYNGKVPSPEEVIKNQRLANKKTIDSEVDKIMSEPHGDLPPMTKEDKLSSNPTRDKIAEYGKFSQNERELGKIQEEINLYEREGSSLKRYTKEIADLEAQAQSLRKEQKRIADKLISPIVTEKTDEIISDEGDINPEFVTKNAYGFNVPNLDKIRESGSENIKSEALRKKYQSELKSSIDFAINVPQKELEERTAQYFKESSGKTLDDITTESFTKGFKDSKFGRQQSELIAKAEGVKSMIEETALSEQTEYTKKTKAKINELTAQFNAYQETVSNAQYSTQNQVDVANMKLESEYKSYVKDFDELIGGLAFYNNQVANRANSEWEKVAIEIDKKSQRLSEDFAKTYQIPKEVISEYNIAQRRAAKDIYAESNNKKSEQIRSLEGSADNAIAEGITRAQLETSRWFTGTLSSLGGSMAAMFDSEIGEDMEQYFQPSVKSAEKFKDMTLASFVESSGSLTGSMIPSIAASMTAAAVTKNLSFSTRVLTTALAAWSSETWDISARMYRTTLDETGSIEMAKKRSGEVIDSQIALAPTYAFEGLPFIGAFKKIKYGIPRVVAGAGVEYFSESVLQEYPQQLIEESINLTNEYENAPSFSNLEKLETTMVETLPVAFLGGFGAVNRDKVKLNASNVMLSEKNPLVAQQALINFIAKNGKPAAKLQISALYQNGFIEKAVFESMGEIIEETDNENSVEYNSLKFRLSELNRAVEAETDPVKQKILKQHEKEVEQSMTDILEGNETDMAHVKIGDNNYFFTPQEFSRLELPKSAKVIKAPKGQENKTTVEQYGDTQEVVISREEREAKEEVGAYISDITSETETEVFGGKKVVDETLNKINNAEYINDTEIDEGIEAVFNEIDRVNGLDISESAKKNITDELYNIAEQLDNYEFRTKTTTQRATDKAATTSTTKPKREVPKKQTKGTVDGVDSDLTFVGGNTVNITSKGQTGGVTSKTVKVTYPSEFLFTDENGEFSALDLETDDGRKITITDPQIGVPLAMNKLMDETATVPTEAVVEEVNYVKENTKETPVKENTKETPVKEKTGENTEGVAKVIEKPSAEQQFNDVSNGDVVTFTYDNDSQVPDVFKDKISSRGDVNGKPFIKVTVAKSLADYELQTKTPTTTETKQETVEVVKDTKEVEKVAKVAGVKAKNIKGLYDINRKMFGQNRVKSLAISVVTDIVIGTMAKRDGISKDEMYAKIEFRKGDKNTIKELSTKGKALFQIVGENANLAQTVRDNLATARSMENEGKGVKTIRLSTGWERGADGLWRYETVDNIPFFKDTVRTINQLIVEEGLDDGTGILGGKGELILPPELLKLYPQLKDVEIFFDRNISENEGAYYPNKNKIVVGLGVRPENTIRVLLHEVQHVIQGLEGFAKGGDITSSFSIKSDIIKEYEKELKKRGLDTDQNLLNSITKRYITGSKYKDISLNDFGENRPPAIANRYRFRRKVGTEKIFGKVYTKYEDLPKGQDFYKNIAGEVESRNVENRMYMTSEQRRQTTLQETEDVAIDEKIILFQGEKAPKRSLKQQAQIFKSTAKEGLGNIQQKSATPEQWVKMITDKGGKGTSQELEWIGLNDYLNEWKKENNAKSVPKEVVEQYIEDNQIEIVEVSKSDNKRLTKAEMERAGFTFEKDGDFHIIKPPKGKDYDFESVSNLDLDAAIKSAQELYADDIDFGKGKTRYSTYQLEGGENYREVLLTLPNKKKNPLPKNSKIVESSKNKNFKYKLINENGDTLVLGNSEEEVLSNWNNTQATGAYSSSHWDESNILAHLRINERTLPNGERVMFIEEVQSDWAQEGKKKGFKDGAEVLDLPLELQRKARQALKEMDYLGYDTAAEARVAVLEDPNFVENYDIDQEHIQTLTDYKEARISRQKAKKQVPQMPYKKTDQWVGMAMRRAMQMAVQEGFDRVAWVTGEQSADRYSLSKQADEIQYYKFGKNDYLLSVNNKGKNVFFKDSMTEEEVENTIGKELANKIVNDEGVNKQGENNKFLSGVDLEVGGEGMKTFYNSILPKVAKKEAQRFDKNAKVEVVDFNDKKSISEEQRQQDIKAVSTYNKIVGEENSFINSLGGSLPTTEQKLKYQDIKARKEKAKNNLPKDATVQNGGMADYDLRIANTPSKQLSIAITPEMRMNLNSAVPLFQGEQGAMLAEDGNYIIYALTDPNVSTPLHEIAHVFEHYLTDAERKQILSWAGKSKWDTSVSEKFARGFEKYLATGKAPTSNLQKIFDKFKEWLTEIYNGIEGSEIDIELNDKMKTIYDKMLTEKEESGKSTPEVDKLSEAKAKLSDTWAKWKQSQKNSGVIYDPASKAKEDVELADALVEYLKAVGAKTIEDIKNAIKDFTNGEIEVDDKGAKVLKDKLPKPESTQKKVNKIKEKLKEDLKTSKQKNKDLKARKDELISLAKGLLTDLKTAGVKEVSSFKVKALITQIGKSNTQNSVDKASQKLIEITNGIEKSYVTNYKKNKIQKIKTFVSNASRVKRTNGKVKGKSTDPAGQTFFKQVAKVLKALQKGEMQKIKDEIDAKEDEILQALQKNEEDLTQVERDLLDLTFAYDSFENIDEMSIEELDVLEKGIKDAKAESISRQKQTRKDFAEKKEQIEKEANKFLETEHKDLYDENGDLITNETLEQKKRRGRKMASEMKLTEYIKEKWTAMKRGMKAPVLRSMLTLSSYSTLLDKKSSFIRDRVKRPLDRMLTESLRGTQSEFDNLDNLVESTTKFKTFKDLIENFGDKTVEIKVGNKTWILDNLELMRIYALSLNEVQAEKLSRQGFDVEVMSNIKDTLGEDVTTLVDSVVDYLSNPYYETVNGVHKKVNYTALPRVENYFPTKTERATAEGVELGTGDFTSVFNAQTQSALKERVDKNSKVVIAEEGLNFGTVLKQHFEDMERFKAYAEGVKELDVVFRNKGFSQLLSTVGVSGIIRGIVDVSINPNAYIPNVPSRIDKFISNFTSFQLIFKPIQVLKQATSFINAYEDYSFRKDSQTPVLDLLMYAYDVAKMIPRFNKEIQEAKKLSPDFRDRIENANMYELYSGSRSNVRKESKSRVKGIGNWFTFAGDILGVMGYKAVLNRDLENGMPVDQAVEKFNNYNETQQSRRKQDLTQIQLQRNYFSRLFTAFQSTTYLMLNKSYSSGIKLLRGLANGKLDLRALRGFTLSLGVANTTFVAASNIFKLMFGDEDDEEEVIQELIKAAIGVRMISSIPIVGTGVNAAADWLLFDKSFKAGIYGRVSSGIDPFTAMIGKIYRAGEKIKDDEDNWEGYFDAINLTQGMFTGINEDFVKGFVKLYEGEDDLDAVMYLLGISKSYRPNTEETTTKGDGKIKTNRPQRTKINRIKTNRVKRLGR